LTSHQVRRELLGRGEFGIARMQLLWRKKTLSENYLIMELMVMPSGCSISSRGR